MIEIIFNTWKVLRDKDVFEIYTHLHEWVATVDRATGKLDIHGVELDDEQIDIFWDIVDKIIPEDKVKIEI